MQLTSTAGKTVVYNGRKMKIFTALQRIYETQEINSATINGRVVRFSNAGWRYVDEIPQHLLRQHASPVSASVSAARRNTPALPARPRG